MRRFAAAMAVLVVAAAPSWAAVGTFYVDVNNPAAADNNPGTQAQPFKSMSAADHFKGGPGATIIVKGGPYHEQLTVDWSGTQATPYVIKAADSTVVIDGSEDFSDPSRWAPGPGTSWVASSVMWTPRQVFVADSVRLDSVGVAPENLPVNSYTTVFGQGLYVNLGGDNPALHQVRVGFHDNAFRINNRQWVRIEGFNMLRTEQHAVFLTNSSNISVVANHIRFPAAHGIGAQNGTGLLIDANVISDCGDHGINFISGINNSVVQYNESFHNARGFERAANGFMMFNSVNDTLRRNRAHDNEDTGFGANSSSTGLVSIQNLSYANGDHGYDHLASPGALHVGDVAYGNKDDGFSFEGGSTGGQLFDCIAANNGLTTGRFDVIVDSSSVATFASDYNVVWNSTAQNPVKFNGVQYNSLAAFHTATGQDANTLQSDPRFADAAHGDFHLLLGSRAIDSANSGAPGWPGTDYTGHAPVDDPGAANTGIGPVTYADRGAYEFIRGGNVSVEDPTVSRVALGPAFPNPARGPVAFALELAHAGMVRWAVTDVQGRIINRGATSFAAGHNTLHWQGADSRMVAAGIYAIRIDVDGETLTRHFAVVH